MTEFSGVLQGILLMETCAYQAKSEPRAPLVMLGNACATCVAKPRM